jgi:ribosomal-protein-alanine N-acetyltransferase
MSIDAAFTRLPTLTTARLILRPVTLADVNAFYAIKSDPRVTVPYGVEPHATPDRTRTWVEDLLRYQTQRDALFWTLTLKGDDRAIGGYTLWNFSEDFRCAELGYELHPDFRRQGLSSEAITAILDYSFDALDLHRIEACPSGRNTASSNILFKLGFTHEGTLRERFSFRGDFYDQLYFGLLKTEWLARK